MANPDAGGEQTLDLARQNELFEAAVPEEPLFATALDRYFDGERDDQTLDLLNMA